MSLFDDVRQYLPKHLSEEATKALFDELQAFPNNIDARLYGDRYADQDVNQGDGVRQLPIVHLPKNDVKEGPVIVVSNSCDIAPGNPRRIPPTILYCPIIRLARFVEEIKKNDPDAEKALGSLLFDIRHQRFTSIFYLPSGSGLAEEWIALLDRINNCDLRYLYADPTRLEKIFALSQYGWYLLLLKLSIHLTRMQEGFARG